MPNIKEQFSHLNRSHKWAKGLVHCWRFNEKGRTIYDLSGRGFHLSLNTGTAWDTGPNGPSMFADNNTNHFASRVADQCANIGVFGFPFSIRVRMRIRNFQNNAVLMEKGAFNTIGWIWMSATLDPVIVNFNYFDGTAQRTPANLSGGVAGGIYDVFYTIPNGQASHTIISNGVVKVSSGALTGQPTDSSARDFRIGSQQASTPFDGWVDTVMMWTREVTPHEARAMYLDDRALFKYHFGKDH